MALHDMAKMTVTGTPGTGTITLNAAVSGFQTFAAAGVTNSEVVSYSISDGTSWEVGRGAYTTSGTTLARGPIYSSNSNSAISATSAAVVAIVVLAEDIIPFNSVTGSEAASGVVQIGVANTLSVSHLLLPGTVKASGGTATTTKPALLIEPTGTTSNNWSTSGTQLAVNAVSGFAGNVIDLQIAGSRKFGINSTGAYLVQPGDAAGNWYFNSGPTNWGQCISYGANGFNVRIAAPGPTLRAGLCWGTTYATATFITSPATAGVQLGDIDAAAPVAQTLQVQSVVAGTSNTSGVDFTIQGSRGSGDHAGGDIVFKTAPAGGSGTGQNAAAEVARVLAVGNVKFTNAANFSANGSVATVLGSIGPAGAATTVQTWLTIVDSTGATRYIPCF